MANSAPPAAGVPTHSEAGPTVKHMTAALQPQDQPEALPVRVIRSAKRKKSSAARVVDGVIEIRIPSWMSTAQEDATVAELVAKIEKKRAVNDAVDLMARGRKLAAVYKLPMARDIRWVTNQTTRWGSCSFEVGEIRISSRLARVPDWVLDYVLLHELTHLIESGHGPEFHRLMDRYPRSERAEGFLDAMALGCADPRFTTT